MNDSGDKGKKSDQKTTFTQMDSLVKYDGGGGGVTPFANEHSHLSIKL